MIETTFPSDFNDAEYRNAYAEDFLDMILARQIRALRKQRNLTQTQLADMIGTGQSRISDLESEEYGSMTVNTLKDLARAFDVTLAINFQSYADFMKRLDRTSMVDLQVPSFSDLMSQSSAAMSVQHSYEMDAFAVIDDPSVRPVAQTTTFESTVGEKADAPAKSRPNDDIGAAWAALQAPADSDFLLVA